MPFKTIRPALLAAAVLAATTLNAHAESLASSASSAGSASSASVSHSIEGSSDSSSRAADRVAGDYRVVDVAQAPGRPGELRLTLQRLDDAGAELRLYVPAGALAQPLATGERIRARERGYGYEFRRGDAPEPFFLALHDAPQRELAPRAVTL
ncbi:hypothetical protein [Rubrivivax benzoatilyticus]|uniref:Uncharacterized protein n=1 Tax=Rubrivivax benzoatilyticus TaxID=316997 RepID=A0ABX0HYX3_9BURK|nr:hypothetical protein [Rubrivivax benzoatilyticus]EGJ11022.1 hypothetical protein RBXJA2T_11877 [Rubrivivax benzoatilyticus JA2 = ATCC BAA-35]NHK99625.1 hypothetical protein [Rubrivivax benzoatilyticus]NHL25499.1 hypothetical protein [Rubrivivax benzoatilyticus]